MEKFINSILNGMQNIAQDTLQLLPRSPFRSFIDGVDNIPMVKYLNFFLPIDLVIPVLVAWGTAIGLYYMYSIILRWVKAID